MQPRDHESHPAPLHAVHFYNDDGSLCRIVANFLGAGLTAGQPALVIATPAHRAEILGELSKQAFDVDRLMREDALRMVDAETALASFVVDGDVRAPVFRAQIGALLGPSAQSRAGQPACVYGEMVDLLWRNQLHQTAVRLETLWNQLAAAYRFSLLCSYSIGYFHKDTHLDDACRGHSHRIGDSGELEPIGAVRSTVEG